MADKAAELGRLWKVTEAVVAELERQGVAEVLANLGFDPTEMAKVVIKAADGNVVPFKSAQTSISKDGQTATVRIPVTFLQRGGRKQILSPPGASPCPPRASTCPSSRPWYVPPLAANARKWRVRFLSRTRKGREGQRFLSEPHPAADPDRARHHRRESWPDGNQARCNSTS
jgi:sulfur carrier protein ThiS